MYSDSPVVAKKLIVLVPGLPGGDFAAARTGRSSTPCLALPQAGSGSTGKPTF